jgi:molecular chaperone DnaK
MSNMIDFGIDLGTTNSLIARCVKGSVEVIKNPTGFRETLPSVVGFRKERILVGDQARTYAEKDPKSVVSRFKRKMGTTEAFQIRSLGQAKTPVELSAFVLKELKTFVNTGSPLEAAVITVPASFDSVQSNATKEAGLQAGFRQVVLLQEPIAASLAYANKRKERDLRDSQWLVYDLGGGTFDVALIRIINGELKVLDHEGDNFLGGADFDSLIVERLIVPRFREQGAFANLESELKSESGRYNTLWHILLHLAEEAKVTLSAKTSADVEFEVTDDDGERHDVQITITRSEFDEIIREQVDRTVDMIRSILTRNALQPPDVLFVLMVGGSTYIPYVRRRVEESLQVHVNCEVDPVTAVAVGAAHFAATREKRVDQDTQSAQRPGLLHLRVAYTRATQDTEELFSAKIDGATAGLSYRITREDGGYDSGIKALAGRLSEDLPLVLDTYNVFHLQIVDGQGRPVEHNVGPIQIAQGRYSVAGQSVPHDVCLVLDDLTFGRMRPEPLFPRNSLLPARTRRTVTVNRTIVKGQVDDPLKIMVVEGVSHTSVEANQTIGHLIIRGEQFTRDVLKGTDVELTIEMSESRELTVSAYIASTGQAFEKIFSPKLRDVTVEVLAGEVELLGRRLHDEVVAATDGEHFELAGQLQRLNKQVEDLDQQVAVLTADDVTDDRYKLEDRKRKIASELDALTRDKLLDNIRREYEQVRDDCLKVVGENGNDAERRVTADLVRQGPSFISSKNPLKIREQIETLRSIHWKILRRTPEFLVGLHSSLVEQRQRFNDQAQAKSLIEAGKVAIAQENYERLDEINCGLINLLPQREQEQAAKGFTGIS